MGMKRTRPVACVILVLLLSQPAIGADEPRPSITTVPEIPTAVHDALQSRKFAKAVEEIDGLLKRNDVGPADYLMYLKGRALTEAGKLDEATAVFNGLEKEFPKSRWVARSRFGRADMLVRQRNYRAAGLIYQAEAKHLLSTDRRDELAGIYLEFADRYFEGVPAEDPSKNRKPDFQQALTYYKESLKLKPSLKTRQRVELRIADCHRNLKQPAEAIAAYHKFLKEHASDDTKLKNRAAIAAELQAKFRLGRVQLANGQFEDARRTWQDFLADDSVQKSGGELVVEATYRLAHTWQLPKPPSVTDLELGVAAHERFLNDFAKSELAPQAALEIAQSYAHHRRYDQAVERLQKLIEETDSAAKQVPLARNLLGQALAAQKKFSEAIAAWRDFLTRHPSDPNWSSVQRVVINTEYAMAEEQRSDQKFETARQLWETFLNKYPLDTRAPQILFLFGHMRFAEGAEQYRNQLEAEKDKGEKISGPIAPKPKTRKLFDEAIADWQRLVSKYPNTQQSSQAAFAIGTTLEDELGRLSDALDAYRKVKGPFENQAKQRMTRLTAKQLKILTERKFNSDQPARIRLTTRNVENVSVRTYRIDMVDYFRKMHLATGVEALDIALIDPDNIREHEVAGFEEYRRIENEIDIPVDGPGVTAVTVTGENLEATTMVVVSDLDIIVKSSRNELFVFAQNSRTGKPQTDVSLLVSDGTEVFAEELSGKDGIFQKSYEQLKSIKDLRVFAVHEGHAASTVSNLTGLDFAVGLSPKGYLFTDRPAYRAGQLVNLKGIVRWVSDDRFVFKPGEKYQLDVYDARGRLVHTRMTALNKFGAIAANFELPESSPEGECRVHLHQPGGKQSYETTFLVHEYQLESVRLEVETPKQVYYRGDTIEGTISLKYYYGTPLAGKTINYRLADGPQKSAVTNAKGKIAVSFPTRRFRESQQLSLSVEYPEKNLSTQSTVQLATRGFAINVATLRRVFISGETFDSTITVSDPAGNPVGTDLTLQIFERTKVNGKRGERLVDTFEIRSDKKGEARRTLRIDDAGSYIIRATGTDQFDNKLSGSLGLTISGDDDRIRLRLLANRHEYKVGDNAGVKLHWREDPALALVTYEGASILGYQLVPLKKGANNLSIPMQSKLAPNFNLSVVVMQGNRFHQASSEFRVARKLNITLKPNKTTLKPGDELKVEVLTTDPQGKPVSAEVSLGLVQQNLWNLFGDRHGVIDEFFGSGYREPQVRAASSCTFLYRPTTQAVNEFLLAEEERENRAERNAVALNALQDARVAREVADLSDRFEDLVGQNRLGEAKRLADYANTIAPNNESAKKMFSRSQVAELYSRRRRGLLAADAGTSDVQLFDMDSDIDGLSDAQVLLGDEAGIFTMPLPQAAAGRGLQRRPRRGGEGRQSEVWVDSPSSNLEDASQRGRKTSIMQGNRRDVDELRYLTDMVERDGEKRNTRRWEDSNANGQIAEFQTNLSLVIRQTQDFESEAVEHYFNDLSQSEDTIVALNGRGEFQVLNGIPTADLKAMAGDGLEILPHMASAELGYWNPTIVTDKSGKATLTFRLPERSTAWKLKSRGIDGNELAGQAEVDIVSKKDLFGEIRTASAFVDGDKTGVLIEVHNSTVKKGEEIDVVLKTSIGERSTEVKRSIKSIGPGVSEISIPIAIDNVGTAEFELTVKSGDLTDTSSRTVPIRPYGVPVFATAGGSSAQSTLAFVEFDKRLPVSDPQLQILIGPSIDRTLLEAVIGAGILPWPGSNSGGFERSISDVLGGVSLLKLISRSTAEDSPEIQELTARVNSGVARLVSSQRDDGAWSWSGRYCAESDRYITSRAVWALSLARSAGFSVPVETIGKAVSSLKSEFTNSGTADREGQAILLHGLAEADSADFAWANRLYRERNNLSVSGLLHVALTLIRLDRKEMAEDLIELVDLAVEPETASDSIQEAAVLRCVPWMRTGVELRALYLLALEELYPTDRSAAQTADWLMRTRRGSRWNPEKANGPAVMALAEWFSRAKFSSEKYKLTIQVNDKDVETIEVDPAVDGTRRLSVPRNVMVAGKPQKISLQMEGRGRFSYSVVLSGSVAADQLKSTSGDWRVSRYREPAHRMLDGELIPRGFGILTGSYSAFRNPLTQLPVGERAEVTLRVRRSQVRGTKNEQLDYLVIEEPLPAGTSVLRESIRGSFERYEIGPGSITFFVGDKAHLGDIHYTLVGHLTGSYRTVPTIVRSFYRPEQMAVAAAKPISILAQGAKTQDEYRLTPVELYESGKRLVAKGRHAEGGAHLTELFRKHRLNAKVYKEIVERLFNVSLITLQHHQIVEFFEIIKEKYPDVEINFDSIMKVATAYQELGEYERSYLVFRATIEAAFERESQIAGFLDDRSEFVRSVEVMERLQREYPAESYIAIAAFALAGEVYGKAAKAGDDPKLREAGITRVDLINASIQMHEQLLSTWPSDPAADRVSFSLANAVLDLEQYEKAVARCEEYARRYPDSKLLDSFWYVIGYSQFALGNHDEALAMCRKVSEATRKDDRTGAEVGALNKWQAVYIMGQIHHSLGQPSKAISEYERVKERFSDAAEAIDFFTRREIKLPEVTTLAPDDEGKVELKFRNVKEASIKVYRIDLLKFGLMQRNLDRITAINLAGIRPYHQLTEELGDGMDFRDRTRDLKLPLKEEGAYLVVCRGENLYASGLVLVSPLKLEIQEDATSGRVRVTVKDSAKDRYLRNVLVKVIGSANKDFDTGETDLRGIFVAEDIKGTSTIIARAADDQYAFYRGSSSLGNIPAQTTGEPGTDAAASDAAERSGGKADLLENVLNSNGVIQNLNRDNYRSLLENTKQGVKAKAAF